MQFWKCEDNWLSLLARISSSQVIVCLSMYLYVYQTLPGVRLWWLIPTSHSKLIFHLFAGSLPGIPKSIPDSCITLERLWDLQNSPTLHPPSPNDISGKIVVVYLGDSFLLHPIICRHLFIDIWDLLMFVCSGVGVVSGACGPGCNLLVWRKQCEKIEKCKAPPWNLFWVLKLLFTGIMNE